MPLLREVCTYLEYHELYIYYKTFDLNAIIIEKIETMLSNHILSNNQYRFNNINNKNPRIKFSELKSVTIRNLI